MHHPLFDVLIASIPLLALAGLIALGVMSFVAPRAQRRRWRFAFGGLLLVLLAGCGLVIAGIQGLAA